MAVDDAWTNSTTAVASAERADRDRPDPVQVDVLGPLRIRRGGDDVRVGSRQLRCLLTILLARAGRPVSITELVELLWGENCPPSAVNVVHKYVGMLRRLLEPGLPPRQPGRYLVRSGNWYCLPAGPVMLDLARVRQHITAAKQHAAHGELDDALDRYESAWDLWRGPVGEGLADTSAAQATFSAVDQELVESVVTGAEIALRSHRPSAALGPLRRAADLDPFNEVVQADLVCTLAAAGRHAAALRSYRSIRRTLADELGIRPGPALENAHQRVLNQIVLAPAGKTFSPGAAVSTEAVAAEIVELCKRLHVALDVLTAQLTEGSDHESAGVSEAASGPGAAGWLSPVDPLRLETTRCPPPDPLTRPSA